MRKMGGRLNKHRGELLSTHLALCLLPPARKGQQSAWKENLAGRSQRTAFPRRYLLPNSPSVCSGTTVLPRSSPPEAVLPPPHGTTRVTGIPPLIPHMRKESQQPWTNHLSPMCSYKGQIPTLKFKDMAHLKLTRGLTLT